jgi:hypothetical protein
MTLVPHDTEPGLWVNPAWHEGTAGAFALVIGVSSYPEIGRRAAAGQETYGLDQLRVSALTAFEFFRWLGERYRMEGCPLALCWLLVSATEQERAHEPRLGDLILVV